MTFALESAWKNTFAITPAGVETLSEYPLDLIPYKG